MIGLLALNLLYKAQLNSCSTKSFERKKERRNQSDLVHDYNWGRRLMTHKWAPFIHHDQI